MNISNFFKRFLSFSIFFPVISFSQVTVKVNYDDFLKKIPLHNEGSIDNTNINSESIHPTIEQITQLAINRVVTVVSIGPRGNSGSGVYLGLYNFSKNSSGDLVMSSNSDTKRFIVVATNYHVAGVAPLTNIAFKDSSVMTFVPADQKFCHSKRDICLLFIEFDSLLDQQLKDVLLRMENKSNIEMISSKDVKPDQPISYIGYVLKDCFFSNGTVFNKFSDDNYFQDNSTTQKDTSIMLSTNSMFKQGMSGGGVFNKEGQLLGLISFFNVIQNPLYKVDPTTPKYIMGSFFLPTEWISEILQNPKEFKMGSKTNEAPFWFKNQPSFLLELNKVD